MEQFSIQLGNYVYELDAISSGLKFPTTAAFNAKTWLQLQVLLASLIKRAKADSSLEVDTAEASTLRGTNAGNEILNLFLGTEPASTVPGTSAATSLDMAHLISVCVSIVAFRNGTINTWLDEFAHGISHKYDTANPTSELKIDTTESCEIALSHGVSNLTELIFDADAITRSLRRISDMDSCKITKFDLINMDELCYIER